MNDTNSIATPRTWITVQQAADYLSVHTKTIRRWITDGRLTAYRPSARVLRLDLAELDALINASIIEPEGNPAEQDNGSDMQ